MAGSSAVTRVDEKELEGVSPEKLVGDFMNQYAKEMAEAGPKDVKKRSRVPFLLVSLVILAGLLAWNIFLMIHNPPVFTQAELEADAELTLYLTAQGLAEHLNAEGTLPQTLEAVDLDDDHLTYTRLSDSTYMINMVVGETGITYRSGDHLARFERALDEIPVEAVR